MNKIEKLINNPSMIILYFGRKGFFNWMDDEKYISLLFKIHFGYYPDLNNPVTYNEKLQWLKLHNRQPHYSSLADKIEVRKVVEKLIGAQYLIPLLWYGDNYEDISFNKLPNRFVIKCSHDSGSVIICKDKNTLDKKSARKFITKHLQTNLYWAGREWVYKYIKPRILVEKYIGSDKTYPEDYKFYVFNEKIDCVMVCKGREKGYPKFYYYSTEWKRLNYLKDEPEDDVQKPDNLEKMIEIVNILSKGFPAIRIDLYEVNGQIFFGEYTFFNQSGYDLDILRETDEYWGSLINLPAVEKR